MFFKAPSYILHYTLCVCALCMHFLFLHFLSMEIYFSNSLSYTLHCAYALFVCASMSFKSVNYILHSTFVFVHCVFCLCIFFCRFFFLNSLNQILHSVYSFCFILYRIFAVSTLSFGCYLCVEVCH